MKTTFEDIKIIPTPSFKDNRGSFRPIHCDESLFVQSNISFSQEGVIRGLHYQKGMCKFVSAISGYVYDVVVDIRTDSPEFLNWCGYCLDRSHSLFIPHGFAHGYLTLSEESVFHYMVNDIWRPNREGGIVWNDPDLDISWPLPCTPVISERDSMLPTVKELFRKVKSIE